MSLFKVVSRAFRSGRAGRATSRLSTEAMELAMDQGRISRLQLVDIAKDRGIKGASRMHPDDLLEVLGFRQHHQIGRKTGLGLSSNRASARDDLLALKTQGRQEAVDFDRNLSRVKNLEDDYVIDLVERGEMSLVGDGTDQWQASKEFFSGRMASDAADLADEARRGKDLGRRINRRASRKAHQEGVIQDLHDFLDERPASPTRTGGSPVEQAVGLTREGSDIPLSKLSWLQNPLKKSARGLGSAFAEHPVLATAGAVGALTWLGPQIADGATSMYQDVTGTTLDRAIQEEYQRRKEAIYFQLKQQRLQRSTVEHMGKLAQYAPDLYNQALAGRQLPTGAAVFGGTKRPDLVEEMAYAMSMGAFQEPQLPDPTAYLGN